MYGKRSWLIRGFTSHLFGQTRHPKAVGSKPRKTTPPPNGYRHHKTGQASSRHETCKTTPQATSKTKAMVCRWSARNMQDYPPMGTSSIRHAKSEQSARNMQDYPSSMPAPCGAGVEHAKRARCLVGWPHSLQNFWNDVVQVSH